MADVFYPGMAAGDSAAILENGEVKPIATPNATYRVYELSDTTKSTPLPILTQSKLPSGPTGREVPVGALPIFPDVYVISPNYAHLWVCGELSFRRDSADAKDQAVADAVNAAYSSAAAAEAAVQEAAAAAVRPTDEVVTKVITTAGSAANAALSATFVAREPEVHVLIGAGQSNGAGRGKPISAALDPVDSRIWMFGSKGRTLTPATVPLDQHDTEADGLSNLTVFAREYVNTLPAGSRVVLIPAAHGGTRLSKADNLTWRSSIAGSLYASMIDQTLAGVAAIEAEWAIKPTVKALLWVQGESDGLAGITEDVHRADLDALIAKTRVDLSLPTLAFIIGGMVPEWVAANAGAAPIHAVHVGTPGRVAYTAFAYGVRNGGGSASRLDTIHYTRQGQEELGRRMFAAYGRALVNFASGSVAQPPRDVSALLSGDVLTVDWSQPACRYTDFKVEYSQDGLIWTTITGRATPADTSATATGVTGPVLVRVSTIGSGTSNPSMPVQAIQSAAAPVQARGFVDTFNRANSATIGATTEGNQTWSNAEGYSILGNQLVYDGTLTGVSQGRIFVRHGLTDFVATVELAEINGPAPFGFSIGTTTNYVQFTRNSTGVEWQSITLPDQVTRQRITSPSLVVGTVKITKQGNAVTLTQGQNVVTFDVTGLISDPTYFGLRITPASKPVRFESISVLPA